MWSSAGSTYVGTACRRGHLEKYASGNCIVCSKERAAAWARTNKERAAATKTRHYNAHKEASLARSAQWALANEEKARKAQVKYRGYPQPTRARPDNCEGCGRHKTEFKRAFALDHCHETGIFRGWLCGNCNSGIGKLGDNLEGLTRAVNYIKKAYN